MKKPKPFKNNVLLRELMASYSLTAAQVRWLVSSEYGTPSLKTIRAWVQDINDMPGVAMALITLRLSGLATRAVRTRKRQEIPPYRENKK